MLSDRTQSAAQVDERRAVEVQGRYSGTSRSGASLHPQEVCTPSEVTQPPLAAGVEQADSFPGLRILCPRLGVFVAVTRRTCPR
jgi:hypothetical protein